MAPPTVGSTIGPASTFDLGSASDSSPVATVRLGETSLSDISKRLGIDKDSLQQANPQISDPSSLKVGQQVFLPVGQGPKSPQENDSGTGHLPPNPLSQSGPPVLSNGDPLAKAMVQMRLADSGPPPGGNVPLAGGSPIQFTSKSALGSEKRLETLAQDPGDAHKAWKNLTEPQRKEVLSKMEARYGKSFVQEFLETEKKGTAKVETQNYQPGTGPSPEKLKAMGYHLGWKAIGNGSIENEFWVHPSGKRVQRDVSTWSGSSSGSTSKSPAVPDKTQTPDDADSVGPSTEVEDKQEKAEGVLSRLQDNINQIQDLLKSNPVPWDQVKQKFIRSNELEGQLKNLGVSGEDPANSLDMSDVDENFNEERDKADQQLLDLRTKADEMNPNFEELMQQPSVMDPDDSE
jgi:hypothetical protein